MRSRVMATRSSRTGSGGAGGSVDWPDAGADGGSDVDDASIVVPALGDRFSGLSVRDFDAATVSAARFTSPSSSRTLPGHARSMQASTSSALTASPAFDLLRRIADEPRNLLESLAERRERDLGLAYPIEQIGAEPPARHPLAQVAVRREAEAHVDVLRLRPAEWRHLLRLEDS